MIDASSSTSRLAILTLAVLKLLLAKFASIFSGSRASASTVCPCSSACLTTCFPTPPVAPRTQIFIGMSQVSALAKAKTKNSHVMTGITELATKLLIAICGALVRAMRRPFAGTRMGSAVIVFHAEIAV